MVSVILPVFNGEKHIKKCLTSLVNQNYPKKDYEIIIIDNNSNDKTLSIAREYPVEILVEENIKSSYAARNKGIRHARGDILAFIDVDCIASRDWISEGVLGFSKEGIGCVAGEIEGSVPEGFVEEYLVKKKELSQNKTLEHEFLPYPKTANVFYLKTVFDSVGVFEKKWESGGDADMAWRMQIETKYKIYFSPKAHVYHKHRSNIKSMFIQSMKWGIGRTFLERKYNHMMKPISLKRRTWILTHFLLTILKLFPLIFKNIHKMRSTDQKKYLDYISYIGWEWGKYTGTLKYLFK